MVSSLTPAVPSPELAGARSTPPELRSGGEDVGMARTRLFVGHSSFAALLVLAALFGLVTVHRSASAAAFAFWCGLAWVVVWVWCWHLSIDVFQISRQEVVHSLRIVRPLGRKVRALGQII